MQSMAQPDLRKLRAEIQNMRERNEDLKEELHEVKQSYLVAKQERDSMKKRLMSFQSEMDNFNKIVNERVAKILKTNQIDLKMKVEEQQQTILKLKEHNKM